MSRLETEVVAGNVNCTWDGELMLFTYSKSAVYDRAWNPTVEMARGLIVDLAKERVVATPFPKFFGVHEERHQTLPADPFEVFDKLDGSLAVVFFHGGRWRAATKGSFVSEQALWAQHRVEEIERRNPGVLVPGTTYCCEALYAANRIVVAYAPEAMGLWLLAAYSEDGTELSYTELGEVCQNTDYALRLVPRRPFTSVAALLERARTLPPDEEGWVLRFASGLRLKLKGDAYLAIHRAVSRLTPLAVWEALSAPDPTLAETMRQTLPEEFWQDFDTIASLLWTQFLVQRETLKALEAETSGLTDKQLGFMLQAKTVGIGSNPLSRLLFTSRKTPDRVPAKLWALVRPTGNRLEGYTPTSGVSRIQEDTL